MYDRYQKAREGLNIEEAMVIKKSALDVTGFAKLLRTVYIDENAAGDGYAVCLRHFLCAAGSGILFLLRRIRIYSYSSLPTRGTAVRFGRAGFLSLSCDFAGY